MWPRCARLPAVKRPALARASVLAAMVAILLALAACTRRNPRFRVPAVTDASADKAGDDAADGALLPDADIEPDADSPVADADVPAVDHEEADQAPEPDLAVDAARPADTASPPPDVAPDTGPDLRPPVMCGTARPNVSSIEGTDGIAIGPDGTIYFTSDSLGQGWVGRMVGNVITREWLRIDDAPLTAGLALNRTGTKLYVALVSGTAIIVYDLAANPIVGRTVVSDIPLINDLAIAPDGSTIYFSRQSDRNVYLLRDGATTAVKVTTATIGATALDQAPAGLAFGPDGALYVGVRKGGNIQRLLLDGQGLESSRAPVAMFSGWANGLAFDLTGRLYVATYDDDVDTRVLRLAPDSVVELESGDRFASMAFGRGTLSCHDLYIAVPSGGMRVRTVDIPGFYVAP
jgi:sugar lactone lactonase YvrE